MIRIAVVGASGRMGQTIIEAINQNDKVSLGATLDKGDDLSAALDQFDVLIDFTRPEATLEYLSVCQSSGKAMVIGTTGFSDEQLQVINDTANHVPIVFAPNMSVGVNLSLKLLDMAARVIGEDADIEIVEAHHRHKVDAPSGTALGLGRAAAAGRGTTLDESGVLSREGITDPRDRGTIGFATLRGGDVAGEHTVIFAADGERIELTHKAGSRQIFARGAVQATLWARDKDKGLYSMLDVLQLG